MFGHDRFGESENFGAYFKACGGSLSEQQACSIIREVFTYLASLYPDPQFRERFPSIRSALDVVVPRGAASEHDLALLVETFAHHEKGAVPTEFAEGLLALASTHRLGLVADIWAPRDKWMEEFERAGISSVFEAMSFSSDHGVVKPSPRPFQQVLRALGSTPAKTVVIGDSARRDLGGANAAGVECILVGGAMHESALCTTESLLCLL